MKRLVYSLAIICFLLLSVSCQKEGVFNPQKKLVQTTIEAEGTMYGQPVHEKEANEMTFYWDGKKLKKIGYYEGSEQSYDIIYNYDSKGRVTSIEDQSYGDKCVLTYEGKFMTSVDLFRGEFQTAKLTIEHNGKQISKIHQEFYNNDAVKSHLNPLALILDKKIADRLYNNMKAHQEQTKSVREHYDLTLTWKNDNISKLVALSKNGYEASIVFEYDNHKNPYHGFFDINVTDMGPNNVRAYSKNNMISYQYSDETTDFYTQFEYTYDGDYPDTQKDIYTGEEGRLTYITHYYYE